MIWLQQWARGSEAGIKETQEEAIPRGQTSNLALGMEKGRVVKAGGRNERIWSQPG